MLCPLEGLEPRTTVKTGKTVYYKESVVKGSVRGGQEQRRQGLSSQRAPSEVMTVGPDCSIITRMVICLTFTHGALAGENKNCHLSFAWNSFEWLEIKSHP